MRSFSATAMACAIFLTACEPADEEVIKPVVTPNWNMVAAPPPAPPGPLVNGVNCVDQAQPSSWQLRANHQAKVADADFVVALPPHWRVTQERPELVVLSGPRSGLGPQPQFELLLAPPCESYQLETFERRLATRSLAERYSAADVEAVWNKVTWVNSAQKKTDTSLAELNLLMRDAEVALAVFTTPVAKTPTEGVLFAAACPRNGEPRRACEGVYRTLVASVKFVPAPPVAPTPDVAPSTD